MQKNVKVVLWKSLKEHQIWMRKMLKAASLNRLKHISGNIHKWISNLRRSKSLDLSEKQLSQLWISASCIFAALFSWHLHQKPLVSSTQGSTVPPCWAAQKLVKQIKRWWRQRFQCYSASKQAVRVVMASNWHLFVGNEPAKRNRGAMLCWHGMFMTHTWEFKSNRNLAVNLENVKKESIMSANLVTTHHPA